MSNGQLLFAHEIYVSQVNHMEKGLGKNKQVMKLDQVKCLLAGADVKKEIDLISSAIKEKKGEGTSVLKQKKSELFKKEGYVKALKDKKAGFADEIRRTTTLFNLGKFPKEDVKRVYKGNHNFPQEKLKAVIPIE